MKKFFFVLLSILCISTLAGCVGGKLHRKNTSICTITGSEDEKSCPNKSLQQTKTGSYLLGIVEFDDQGQFYGERQQLTELLTKLKEEAKKRSLLIITFVHGWHHSAKEGDENLQNFKKLLEKINEEESRQKERPQRKTVGVYLGWRGDSIRVPVLQNMTFWDRKDAAETIGTQGAVTETLLELDKIVTSDSKKDNRLVIVGHSFGGLIVYSALAHILLDRSISSDSVADGVGDLIVLINPAFEALRFANLYFSTKNKKYDKKQSPLMIILTSKGDMATRIAFPVGRFLSAVVNFYRKIGEYQKIDDGKLGEFKADMAAIGHFEPFENGELYPSEKNSAQYYSPAHIKKIQEQLANENCVPDEDSLVEFLGTDLKLKCSKSNYLHYPYWVVSVDEEIIPDHSKIWGDDVSSKDDASSKKDHASSKISLFLRGVILATATRDSKTVTDILSENKGDGKFEYCDKSTPKQPTSHNEKVIEARTWELRGFQQLLNKNWECAKLAFGNSHKTWPTYHNVEEILKLLNDPQGDRCDIYRRILKSYSWGMPKDFKESMESMEGKCP